MSLRYVQKIGGKMIKKDSIKSNSDKLNIEIA